MPQMIVRRCKREGNGRRYGLLASWLVLAALLALQMPLAHAAAGDNEFKAGMEAEARQDYDEAYRQYQAAVQANPSNPAFLMAFERARFQAAAVHVDRGNKLQNQGNLEDAAAEYEIAAAIDPSSPIARQALELVRSRIQDAERGVVADQGTPSLESALGPPELKPLSLAPINLTITNDSRIVTETIAKMAGINALFDPDYTGRRITVQLNNVTLREALDHVALQTRTFWKPVTQNTIMVIPDTAVKRREQEQQIIKTFYLSNTITPQDLTEVVTAIRTLLETRRIQQVNSMNAIILRDTPDKVALAEKIIRDVDKAKPEVVVDVAVLEVRRDKARQLGFAPGLPGLQIPITFTPTGTRTGTGTTTDNGTATSNSVPLNRLDSIGSPDWSITLPGGQLSALLTDSHTKILQRPEVRASDGMRATLRIGDRVPIATGAYQPGVAGQAVSALVNTQFQYQDVGVNMDITPKVHQNQEITLKVRVEVSAVTSTAEPVPGVKQPVIGQRIIEHDIRLREGEMNILGGILQSGSTQQVSGIPGLSQIPLLKYLFSNVSDSVAEDEVLIVLRPRTVRLPDITPLNLRAIDVGTEGDVRLREAPVPFEEGTEPQAPPAEAPETPPAAPPAPAATPAPAPAPDTPPGPRAAADTASPSYASLRLGEIESPRAGETFELPVQIENARDVFSFPFELQYDSVAVKFLGVKKGDFWTGDGQPVAIVERQDEESGNTLVTLTRPPDSGGVSGNGTVAVLNFQAERAGDTSLGVIPTGTRSATDQILPVQAAQAQVTIR